MKCKTDSETEQMINRVHRSNYIKQYFMIIGVLCVFVVCILFFLLDFGLVKSLPIVGNNLHSRQSEPHNSPTNGKNPLSFVMIRERRDADSKIREKKRILNRIDEIRASFDRCKTDSNKNCDIFYKEMETFKKLLDTKTKKKNKTEIYSDYIYDEDDSDEIDHYHKQPNKFGHVQPMPKVHEDLDTLQHEPWRIEKEKSMFESTQHRPENLMPFAAQPDAVQAEKFRQRTDDKVVTPLKSPGFDPSGQLLQICDQIGRQSSHQDSVAPNNSPGPTSSGFVTNNVQPHAFIPNNFQQQQQQQIGATQFSPNPMYRSNPICFYNSPNVPQIPFTPNAFVPQQQFVQPMTANAYPTGRFVYVPAGTQQPFGMTATTGQGFLPVMNQPQFLQARAPSPQLSQPIYCTYPQMNQQPFNQQLASSYFAEPRNVPQENDVIYAAYGSQRPLNNSNMFNTCDVGQISCTDTSECISTDKWCDNVVDCFDSSDETACSCESRLEPTRLCDGYLDCPIGTDEIGCFGCDKFSFSCYSSVDEFNKHKQSSMSMCYSRMDKCDGIENCLNGKDEEDCSMLVKDIGLHKSFMVPYTEGFLFRNFRGRYYPVCSQPDDWANEACESELGHLDEKPQIKYLSGMLPGPFVSKPRFNSMAMGDEVQFSSTCVPFPGQEPKVVRVQCPPMKCGIRKKVEFDAPKLRIRDEDDKDKRDKRDETLRIVGGDRSLPHEWPFIVAIYKNGRFHCGGTIHTADWIITAAHCVEAASKHYYEVHAGMLRRFSYSPEVQIVKVSHVIRNNNFQEKSLSDDVALIRLDTPLLFNRWVKPICLPTPKRIKGEATPNNWINGPDPGTLCTAVGWGAIRERGPSPDNLKEVNVPILDSCRHAEDIDGDEICAGEIDGGRDACQGDSGGPLFCQSNGNPSEFYLAGIVSHGDGCARRNEPGVYTRVALYIEWIADMENSDLETTGVQTQSLCPGFVCAWSGHCISSTKRCDNMVDCLGGEDELQCAHNPEDMSLGSARNQSNLNDISNSDTIPEEIDTKPIVLEATTILVHTSTGQIHEESTKIPIIDAMDTTNGNSSSQKSTTSSSLTDFPVELSTTEDQKATITTEDFRTKQTSAKPSKTPMVDAMGTDKENQTSFTTLGPMHDSAIELSTSKHHLLTTTSFATEPIGEQSTTNPLKPTKHTFKGNHSSLEAKSTTLNPFDDFSDPSAKKPKGTTDSPLPLPMDLDDEFASIEKHKKRRNITSNMNFIPTAEKFKCMTINQTLSLSLRCDGIRDCEDGSDEVDCTCRDRLKAKTPQLICDGKVQCLDLTDEQDCLQCAKDEFKCSISKQCIPKTSRCDKLTDCKGEEDEADCLALTDGTKVLIEADLKPSLRRKGIVVENKNGVWSVMCLRRLGPHGNGDELAGEICTMIGFTGYMYHNFSRVTEDGQIKQHGQKNSPRLLLDFLFEDGPGVRSKRSTDGRNGSIEEILTTPADRNCFGLYIECSPYSIIPIEKPPPTVFTTTTTTTTSTIRTPVTPTTPMHALTSEIPDITTTTERIDITFNKTIEAINDFNDISAPWVANIFVNGEPACIGILVDKHWVIADINCVNETNLGKDVTYVILGQSGYPMEITSPFTQIVRVDCMHVPNNHNNNTNVILLHLSKAIEYSRAVLPTYLQNGIAENDKDCIAVSHELPSGAAISLPVERNENSSIHENRFQLSAPEKEYDCTDLSSFGVIVCRSNSVNTYYPVSFYRTEYGLCDLKESTPVKLLGASYNSIDALLDWPTCSPSVPEPFCRGYRCPRGKCLKPEQICDGKNDCIEGGDESKKSCDRRQNCQPHEMKCRKTNKCILKTKYCDKIKDCGADDDTDEPEICSCYNYLEITNPSKICDGIPNCPDKTDEHLDCPCKPNSFQCSRSPNNNCIPPQFVCDSMRDCPNGEDEDVCFSVDFQIDNNGADNYARIKQRSSSVDDWQTKCYRKRNVTLARDELTDMCKKLGFNNTREISYNLIKTSGRELEKVYGNAGQKLQTFDSTSTLIVNESFNVTSFQPSRIASTRLVPWTTNDHKLCNQMEIFCKT